VSRPLAPSSVLDAAHARRAARIAQDWPEADRLKAEIEAAGWRVVDRGPDFALVPAHPADVIDDGLPRYGSSASVPSRLDEADGLPATLVIVVLDASGGPPAGELGSVDLDRAQVLVVADDPAPDAISELGAIVAAHRARGGDAELLPTSARLGPGACLNIALRRAIGSRIVVVGPGTRVTGAVVTAAGRAMTSDTAVVGAGGLTGPDVRHLQPAGPGDVAALDGRCLAVPRVLAVRRGPVDERFATWPLLAAWWSLTLRDEGQGQPALRAIALADPPIEPRGAADTRAADERLVRRDRYRLLDAFGRRPDLFERPTPR
jgi:hypothetical protein